VKIAEKGKSNCVTYLHRNSPPFYKFAFKKSLYAPVIVSKFLKCLPPGIIKNTANKPKHIYEILTNIWISFLVFDYGDYVDIYENLVDYVYNQKYNEDTDEYSIKCRIMQLKYINIFVGVNDLTFKFYYRKNKYEMKKGEAIGNTILLQTGKNKYVYIGDRILSFTTKNGDVIKKYYSPVRKNSNHFLSFPYAVGEKYVYFMLHNVMQPVEDFDLKKDVYMQYYEKYYRWHKNYKKKYKERWIEYHVTDFSKKI
jgi:hypothetical protein